ncbi:MAG: branched-chain amino acid ABC transporter permease [Myxococcales bacterium]|nr:branched-chain amino acid ABC transporter permease [Myxococcales bacterium]
MSWANFLQLTVSGLAMGAIYTLTAKGLFIAHLATNRLNFAQGDFLMIAALLTLALRGLGIPVPVVIVAVVLILGFAGWGLERIFIRPLDRLGFRGGGEYSWILTTAGAGLVIQNVAELVWGKSAQYSPPLFSGRNEPVRFLGAGVYPEQLAVIAVSVLVVAAFYWFLFRTRWGKSIYAVAFNPDAAVLLGIDVRRMVVLVFALASMLAGISGVLAGPIVSVFPQMGLVFTVKGLAVAAVGGFNNPAAILFGGVLFGLAESFSNYLNSEFGDLLPLLFVLALLIVRPTGIAGGRKAAAR